MKLIQILLLNFIVFSEAFLFPSGGCGCAPPPPPCCIKLPQPCLPQLPPPCLPQIPTCGGCGGRKKREVNEEDNNGGAVKCTDPELRKIIINNLDGSLEDSKNTIEQAASTYLNTTYVTVICSNGKDVAFEGKSETFCIDGTEQKTCGIFKLQ
ncbi:hypothetical protein FO519_002890 [Halicephalobus sp. NKZ332]|nr:hypothetical protein FO519_002890 [Halicephalobus sp. NKZ332]